MAGHLIALGYSAADVQAVRLPLSVIAPIVLAAQPTTAIFHARYGGWTREGHLLAAQMEQRAGLVDLTRRMPRDGVPAEPPKPKQQQNPNRIDSWDAMSIEEFEKLRAANYAKGPSPSKVIGPERITT